MNKPININSADLRLRGQNWINLTELEQRAVMCAAELAHDSKFIPLLAGEITKHFDESKLPQHPEPEWMI